jgi:uncharacterized protein (DUF1697 family)
MKQEKRDAKPAPNSQIGYISMLRGINVGGQKKIKMNELALLYESRGFEKVQTYIQSGNVVFVSPERDSEKLSAKIEKEIKRRFGFDVAVLIRTAGEIQKIIKNNPFKGKDENYLHVTFLNGKPQEIPIEEIIKVKSGSEEFHIEGREIYLFCPNGYGNTKLSNNFFERKLKVAATTRNWRTVNTLFKIACG